MERRAPVLPVDAAGGIFLRLRRHPLLETQTAVLGAHRTSRDQSGHAADHSFTNVQGDWRGRSDAVYALVQRLADAAAEVEGRTPLPVPRLADTVLPDQLRVMVADLVAASPGPDVVDRLAADLHTTRTTLTPSLSR